MCLAYFNIPFNAHHKELVNSVMNMMFSSLSSDHSSQCLTKFVKRHSVAFYIVV